MSHPLDFVTIEGLLAYGRARARRASERGLVEPQPAEASDDDLDRVHNKMEQLRSFITRSKSGFATAEEYRSAREGFIDDQLVFFAAWNALLVEGSLQPLLQATIGAVAKPTYRRPVAIVPRGQLTPTLAEGRIILELGDDRFWLLPRD
jgi:6-phosphofructokinase 1